MIIQAIILLKIKPDGGVLKINKFRIPTKNLGLRLNFLEQSPNGFLYIFGTTLIDLSENLMGAFGYKQKSIFVELMKISAISKILNFTNTSMKI